MPKNIRTMKYKYGDYILTTFSPVGARINKQTFGTYDEAKAFSKELNTNITAIISKILFNSAKHTNPLEM